MGVPVSAFDGEQPEVLFVGHEATRTGAPLMFLYLLRWIREHSDLRFELVLWRGGDLVDDYREVTEVTLLDGGGPGATELPRRLQQVPMVYCNSSASAPVLGLLDPAHERVVVTHVHELEEGLSRGLRPGLLDLVLERTTQFVAASELVKATLVENHGVAAADVVRHYEFIDIDALDDDGNSDVERDEGGDRLRVSLGIPADAPVVGAVGVREMRKGPDLFLAVAALLARQESTASTHFVWLGGSEDDPETSRLEVLIDRSGLRGRMHLVPAVPKPRDWFRLFDVFALTSREDPFPLVCLESSLVGTPVVCFDNTGISEFIGGDECGFVVPYLDVEAMAARVAQLVEDPDLRGELGRRAAERARGGFGIDQRAPLLYDDIERWRARA